MDKTQKFSMGKKMCIAMLAVPNRGSNTILSRYHTPLSPYALELSKTDFKPFYYLA